MQNNNIQEQKGINLTFETTLNDGSGEILLLNNEDFAGKVSFKFTDNGIMEINHTEVDPQFAGKGFGQLLIDKAVVFANDKQLKILPTCPFAKKILEKNPNYQTILAQ